MTNSKSFPPAHLLVCTLPTVINVYCVGLSPRVQPRDSVGDCATTVTNGVVIVGKQLLVETIVTLLFCTTTLTCTTVPVATAILLLHCCPCHECSCTLYHVTMLPSLCRCCSLPCAAVMNAHVHGTHSPFPLPLSRTLLYHVIHAPSLPLSLLSFLTHRCTAVVSATPDTVNVASALPKQNSWRCSNLVQLGQ